VITQNVDGLHHTAGSVDAIEIHGSAGRARCLLCTWDGPAVEAARASGDPRPRCPRCGELVRPAVVLFGESLDEAALAAARRATATCDLFLAVGTSGRVAPASWLAPLARAAGAMVINIDPVSGDPGPAFHRQVTGDAQRVLAEWAES
jgi:NAD-dependent deacetylase